MVGSKGGHGLLQTTKSIIEEQSTKGLPGMATWEKQIPPCDVHAYANRCKEYLSGVHEEYLCLEAINLCLSANLFAPPFAACLESTNFNNAHKTVMQK